MAPGGLRRWLTMTEPQVARVHYPKIDYQDLIITRAEAEEAGRLARRDRSGNSQDTKTRHSPA